MYADIVLKVLGYVIIFGTVGTVLFGAAILAFFPDVFNA
jgi:hypothetical protein